LNFFASFLVSRQEMKSGLGGKPNKLILIFFSSFFRSSQQL